MIINSYKLTDNIFVLKCPQNLIEGILSICKKEDIDILHLNIIFKKMRIYFKNSNLEKIKKNISVIHDYKINGPFAMVEIDYTKEDLLMRVANLGDLLTEKKILFKEIGIMENKLYIIIKKEYKNKFIKIYDKIT